MAAYIQKICNHFSNKPASTSAVKMAMCGCMVITAVLLMATEPVSAAPSCGGPSENPGASEATCENGVVLDWCNRPVCGKGPGEACGGLWNQNGNCGRGMFCGCNVCHGCNRRLQCYFKAKC